MSDEPRGAPAQPASRSPEMKNRESLWSPERFAKHASFRLMTDDRRLLAFHINRVKLRLLLLRFRLLACAFERFDLREPLFAQQLSARFRAGMLELIGIDDHRDRRFGARLLRFLFVLSI